MLSTHFEYIYINFLDLTLTSNVRHDFTFFLHFPKDSIAAYKDNGIC